MITVPQNTEFPPLKQIEAGVLNVGYAEVGPAGGKPVVLLHGWPYDIHSFVEVAPLLAAKGYRVVVPYLRGYGTTRFQSGDTFRNGQQGVLAIDAIAFMDALNIPKAIIAGFDWGARTANIIAAVWPERCKALVSVSGYLIGSQTAGRAPLPPKAELQWWYQYYFATERGRAGYAKYTRDFNKLIWQLARRSGSSKTRRSIARPAPLTTRITSASWSITTGGASDWLKASPNMTISKAGSPRPRTLPCPPSRWRVTPTERHTPTRPSTHASSPASTRTG